MLTRNQLGYIAGTIIFMILFTYTFFGILTIFNILIGADYPEWNQVPLWVKGGNAILISWGVISHVQLLHFSCTSNLGDNGTKAEDSVTSGFKVGFCAAKAVHLKNYSNKRKVV